MKSRHWFSLVLALACNREPQRGPTADDDLSFPSPFDPNSSSLLEEPIESPRARHRDFDLEVLETRVCPLGTIPTKDDERRLTVKIHLQGRSKMAVPTGPLLFSLRGSRGRRFAATLDGCAPPIPSGVFSKQSGSAEGSVAFDVPKNEKRLELWFEPFIAGRPPVRVRALIPQAPEP